MLFAGSREEGLKLCGFSGEKPVIMMMGGSLGSVKINSCLRKDLDVLLEKFQIVHICGKGNKDESLIGKKGYTQFEYASEELPHIFAAADLVISRAGSNSISEFLALKKPSLLIPLSAKASRGDQILNAESFKKQGFSMVLTEEDMNEESLIASVNELWEKKYELIENMNKSSLANGVEEVMKVIRNAVK